MPFAVPLAKWGMVSAAEFATRFKNPFLQRAIPLMFAWPDCPVMVGQSLLAYMHTHNAGFPVGGSLAFARAIEQRYRQLGGEIRYDAQVQEILVENDRAVGVRLYDDSEHRADVVISAADGRGTVFDLLDGRYIDRDLRHTYDGHLPIHSVIQVSLGVKRDLSAEPHWASYLLDTSLTIAAESVSDVGVKHYCFDKTLAPAGKSAVTLLFKADYSFWQRIYARKIYDLEQLQIGDTVGRFLDGLYPGFSDDVEVEDIATPMSYERYTRQLAWLHLRLVADQRHHAPHDSGHAQDVTPVRQLLHGRAMGGTGRQRAGGRHVGPQCHSIDLPRRPTTVCDHHTLADSPDNRVAVPAVPVTIS